MLITWMIQALALEADSMRSRGSLLRGRTAFSIYRFDNRDRAFVIALFTCMTLTAMGVILGATKMIYNPRILWAPLDTVGVATTLGYAALCLLPMGMEVWTEYRFRKARANVMGGFVGKDTEYNGFPKALQILPFIKSITAGNK